MGQTEDDLIPDSWAAATEQLLNLADSLSMGVTGAVWRMHTHPDFSGWHLHLITPLVDEKSPRWIYHRLVRMLTKLSLPEGMDALRMVVCGPKDYRGVAGNDFLKEFSPEQISKGVEALGPEFGLFQTGPFAQGFPMIFFRWIPGLKAPEAKSEVFDRSVQELMAA